MSDDRFLLIKAWSHSLWMDVHQLLEQLLVAELSNRIPVVYWGTNCLYNGAIHNNAFDLYFEAVSDYSIEDLMKPEYTFYPPVWEYDNLMAEDPNRKTLIYRNVGDILGSNANVVVSDAYANLNQIIPQLGVEHPVYGMSSLQVYRYLMKKYLRLKPDIEREIERVYDLKLKEEGPALAVHVRGKFSLDKSMLLREMNKLYHSEVYKLQRSDEVNINDTVKLHEIALLHKVKELKDPNRFYHKEVQKFLGKYNIRKIFLATDYEETLEEYKDYYGSMIVSTDCSRLTKNMDDKTPYLENHLTKRRKGIEVIRDTYLAAKCDFFIGNGCSNFSHAVTRLKDWPETNMKLMYWLLENKNHPDFTTTNPILYPGNDFIDYFKRAALFASNIVKPKSKK